MTPPSASDPAAAPSPKVGLDSTPRNANLVTTFVVALVVIGLLAYIAIV